MTIPGTGGSPYRLKPDRYSSHSRIAAWLTRHRDTLASPGRPCVVLDVGCADGFVGQLLPAGEFWMIGVDVDAEALARLPGTYRQRVLADIEAGADFALERPVDVVVLADVLEHTREPAHCLRALLARHARPGTAVAISVPNVAHLAIRGMLLSGRFDYADRGIMDRTHLRFFTGRSARALCAAASVQVTERSATPVPLPLVHPAFGPGRPLAMLHAWNAGLARAWPGGLGYQLLLFGRYHPLAAGTAIGDRDAA